MTLAELNALEPARFVAALAAVFEHSPWIAAAACDRRPFGSIDALHAAMVDIVHNSPTEAQLALLRAHPELASKAAMRGELTTESNQEQADAGLTRCTAAEFAATAADADVILVDRHLACGRELMQKSPRLRAVISPMVLASVGFAW